MIRTYIHAEREKYSGGISLSMLIEDGNKTSIVEPVTLREFPLEAVSTPFMRLNKNDAQQLMDELWQCGFRPSEGTGSAGSLAATERHLKDMQTIAFRFLEKAKL